MRSGVHALRKGPALCKVAVTQMCHGSCLVNMRCNNILGCAGIWYALYVTTWWCRPASHHKESNSLLYKPRVRTTYSPVRRGGIPAACLEAICSSIRRQEQPMRCPRCRTALPSISKLVGARNPRRMEAATVRDRRSSLLTLRLWLGCGNKNQPRLPRGES